MAFWTRLFGRREDPARRCGACGRTLLSEVRARRSGGDPFRDAVERVSDALGMPAYACDKCGTVVCRGCLPTDGRRPCPKCG